MIKRPIHNSLARWRRGITAAAQAATAGSAGGSAARAGGGRGSGEAHVCFPFSCIIYFASTRGPAARAGAPGQRLSPLPLAGGRDGRGELGHPRALGRRAAPLGRERALAAGSRLLGGDFPRPRLRLHSPPRSWARGAALPPYARPGVARTHRALSPVRARRAPAPDSAARRPKPRANFCFTAGAPPQHVKPPGARAVARVRTEAPPRGRGTGEAAGFKWGPSGGPGKVCGGGSAYFPSPRGGSAGAAARQGGVRHLRGTGGDGDVGKRTPWGGLLGLGRTRQGKWSAHGDAYVAVCAVRASGAKRVHAACDFMMLYMRGQRVCRQESVGVRSRFCRCARWGSGARRV